MTVSDETRGVLEGYAQRKSLEDLEAAVFGATHAPYYSHNGTTRGDTPAATIPLFRRVLTQRLRMERVEWGPAAALRGLARQPWRALSPREAEMVEQGEAVRLPGSESLLPVEPPPVEHPLMPRRKKARYAGGEVAVSKLMQAYLGTARILRMLRTGHKTQAGRLRS